MAIDGTAAAAAAAASGSAAIFAFAFNQKGDTIYRFISL